MVAIDADVLREIQDTIASLQSQLDVQQQALSTPADVKQQRKNKLIVSQLWSP
jgi:hypothetical protein